MPITVRKFNAQVKDPNSGDMAVDPLNVTEIGTGSYSAYLCNITNGDVKNSSYACHWSIQ